MNKIKRQVNIAYRNPLALFLQRIMGRPTRQAKQVKSQTGKFSSSNTNWS
ncbi:MAG TPA: hypothetical protein V6D14_31280 [Coleofasciculaceae cyanobacterium]|jgi:hypothetical protein